MTIPIIIMNVVQNIYSLIDMTVLGKFASDSAVGAVGTCSTLISLCTGLFIGVSTGANAIVSRRIGEGNRERTQRATETALLFSVFGGIALSIIGLTFSEFFLKLINCPDTLLESATLYFRLYFLGAPVMLISQYYSALPAERSARYLRESFPQLCLQPLR